MKNQLNWSDPIIRDGFTQRGYIEEVQGLHGALRFSYRPMLPEDTERIESMRDRDASRDPARVRALIAQEMQKRLESWDVQFDGVPAPITLENVRRTRFILQSKMYNIISGLVATGLDPEWQDDLSDLAPLESLSETLGN